MGEKTWQEYYCDAAGCGKASDFMDGGTRANKKYLKDLGWTFEKAKCFCPECSAEK